MDLTTPDLTPLQWTQLVVHTANTVQYDNLASYTQSTRLSPSVLIDATVLALNENLVRALEQTMLSRYCGYYLQAISMTMQVGNVVVQEVLNKFSTNRSLLNSVSGSNWWTFVGEAFDTSAYTLPWTSEDVFGDIPFVGVSEKIPMKVTLEADYGNDKTIHTIVDESNLAVGKLLDVKLSYCGQTVSIPVNVSFVPKVIKADDFIAISSINSLDTSMKGRWQKLRFGEIRFLKDFIMCSDIIAAKKKAMTADPTNTLLNSQQAANKGFFLTLISGAASPNRVSTMVIISKQTAQQLEVVLRGKLKSTSTRDIYFKNNIAMMLCVVDTTMERFTLYTRDIDEVEEYTLEDIKSNDTKAGPDIGAMVKAFQLGSAPRL